jgi:CRP-like cAMP-binding protein
VVGEMGLLDSTPRSASVYAVDDVETMEISASALTNAMVRYPEIAAALLHVVIGRLRTTDNLMERLLEGHEQPYSNGNGARARVARGRDGPS